MLGGCCKCGIGGMLILREALAWRWFCYDLLSYPRIPVGTQSAADGDAAPEHGGRALQLASLLRTYSLPFGNHLYARIW